MPEGICIIGANALKIDEVNGFFGRDVISPAAFQDSKRLYSGLGHAARSGGKVVGIVLFYVVPSIVPDENLCFLSGSVDSMFRRRGLGTQLMTKALSEAKQEISCPVFVVDVPDNEAEIGNAFLSIFKFVQIECQVNYEHDLSNLKWLDIKPTLRACDYKAGVYRGGNKSLNLAIVDLHRRAYKGRPCIADLNSELLTQRFANPSCCYQLLLHGRQLIGYASFWINNCDCYVDSLIVERQYWGSGTSNTLAKLVGNTALERGCKTLSTVSASSNLAIRRLMEPCRIVSVVRRFCSRNTGDPTSEDLRV